MAGFPRWHEMRATPPSRLGLTGMTLRTFRFYWISHVLLALAVVVCVAVVAGALVVGDSVRATLRSAKERRLGRIVYAGLAGGEGHFRQALASGTRAAFPPQSPVAGVLSLTALASAGDGSRRAGGVRVFGVDSSFAGLHEGGVSVPAEGTVVVSVRLAEALSLKAGDEVVLRVERPDAMRELALAPGERATVAFRVTVASIVGENEFGGFGLENTQVPPLNVFVGLGFLQKSIGLGSRINLLLIGGTVDAEQAGTAIRQAWDFADGGLEWRDLPGADTSELRSEAIFIMDEVARDAMAAAPGGRGVLTYLVDAIHSENRSAPYAFVAGVESLAGVPAIGPGEVVITDWLAEDLGVVPGNTLEFRYLTMGALRTLRETGAVFRVKQVVPLASVADTNLMPSIPGLTDAGDCAGWDTGFPVDMGRVRPKDEAYWDQWRGAPKAFVGLGDARRLWGNRWGSLTALRYAGSKEDRETVRRRIRDRLAEGTLRPILRPLLEEAERSGAQAMDFGQLFLGLSLFLMVAAILMLALLFGVAAEQRRGQTGLLLALGYDQRVLWRWAVGESLCIAVPGVILGCLAGIGYARGLLWMLDSGIGGANPLRIRICVSPSSLLVAAGLVILLVIAIRLAVSLRTRRTPARDLLDGLREEDSPRRRRVSGVLWSGMGVLTLFVAVVSFWRARRGGYGVDVENFFVSGLCLLVAGAAGIRRWIENRGCRSRVPPGSLMALAARNAGRGSRMSFVIAGLTACAVFLLVAVALFEPAGGDGSSRASGTGGFGLLVQTASPVASDLNAVGERQRLGFTGTAFDRVRFVGLRVTEGDDSGCGNLNRAQRPRFAGVVPSELSRRGAFRFIQADGAGDPWCLLEEDWGEGVVPAVADETTLMWGLQKRVGDEVLYEDENGRPFRVRFVGMLANSLLQGLILVPDAMLQEHFPAQAGVRRMLVDVPPGLEREVAGRIGRSLADHGAEVVSCGDRFRQLNALTVLYIRLFQVLGGLGLLLGVAGVAVVVIRNGIERAGELALMRATGFLQRDLVILLAAEPVWLTGLGTLVGGIAAVVAVWPLMTGPRWEAAGWVVPGIGIAITMLVAMAASILAAAWVMRGQPWDVLRQE